MKTTIKTKDCENSRLLAKSLPHPIHSEAEDTRLVQILLDLDESENLSPEEEALAEVLTLLIEDYEEKAHPLPKVSPAASLNALMEDRGLKHKDIWPILGNKGSATEILAGRHAISKDQARRLAESLKVPIDLFIQDAKSHRTPNFISPIIASLPSEIFSTWFNPAANFLAGDNSPQTFEN